MNGLSWVVPPLPEQLQDGGRWPHWIS